MLGVHAYLCKYGTFFCLLLQYHRIQSYVIVPFYAQVSHLDYIVSRLVWKECNTTFYTEAIFMKCIIYKCHCSTGSN